MTYPSNKVVKYGFDSRGRLNTVGDANVATKWVSSIGYQPSQQVASIGLGNGLTENYGYSADRLQLTSQNVKQGTNTLMSMTYSYVADKSRSGGVGTGQANTGQLMDITGSVKDPNSSNMLQRNESYNYDQVARLSQASGFYAQRNYTYDRFGNRTGVSGGSSQTVALQQPGGGVTNNRIASVNGGPNYLYDASGDVTYDAVRNYSYDAESRMVKVDLGSIATYFYDSANRRVKKVIGTTTTYYVWEGSNVIAEYSNAPAGSGATRFYHPDRLSNRMITDGSGVVKGAMDNLPFGEDAGVVGETEKHRFTTYERDSESGSDYALNRQHQYATGRFNRPDVLSVSIGSPQSLNRYVYVGNDPINSADPVGLARESVWGLYWGTFMGMRGGGYGFGQADYDFWGYRIADLPGFGTMWGSLSRLEEWRYGVLVATKWQFDPAFPKATDDFDYGNLVGPSREVTPVKFLVDVSCEKYLNNNDVKIIYDTFNKKVAELTARGLRHNNAALNNISATLNMFSPLGHAYLGCGQQAGRIIEALNGVKDKGLLKADWKFEYQGLPLDIHVWAKATSSNRSDPIIRLDPWKNRITCNALSRPGGWIGIP